MKDVLVYEDFMGSVHFSADDEVFFGKIEGIEDLVSFEGKSVKEIKNSFEEAVEDYIQICQENGKELEKSYKGSFNVRMPGELKIAPNCSAVFPHRYARSGCAPGETPSSVAGLR
jgi:predicted HicB family RNase H-like nuclease